MWLISRPSSPEMESAKKNLFPFPLSNNASLVMGKKNLMGEEWLIGIGNSKYSLLDSSESYKKLVSPSISLPELIKSLGTPDR